MKKKELNQTTPVPSKSSTGSRSAKAVWMN